MTKESYSFEKLPFSHLFRAYVTDYPALEDFYSCNPFKDKDIKSRAERVKRRSSHDDYAQTLSAFHKELGIDQTDQIQKLSQKESLAIVTGQQLGIYGGPVFTIYKTITAILLAKEWEEKLKRPVVPVFWLADEDHDFEEVAWFGIPGNEQLEKVIYEAELTNFPVSEYQLDGSLDAFKSTLKEQLFETDFSDALWKLYDSCFRNGTSFASAFAQMMDQLFSKYGLLIAGSNFVPFKGIVKDTLLQSIEGTGAIHKALEAKTDAISQDYHAQVTLGDTNLFYMCGQQGRVKVEKGDKGWQAGQHSWSDDEIRKLINDHPEQFSPNVFLRPIIQDEMLPTLGYVAGPGELAYYAQMKDLYPVFDLEMPVIFPRFSGTLLESGIDRILQKLPFEWHQYGQRIEDLESSYVELTESHDIEQIFKDWKEKLEDISKEPTSVIAEIDGSLEGMVGSTVSGFENELNKLKGRVYRSVKQQEQTQLQRIRRVKAQLYPDGGLQERQVSFMYFMNKYGIDLWDQLIDLLGKEPLDLSNHHVINL